MNTRSSVAAFQIVLLLLVLLWIGQVSVRSQQVSTKPVELRVIDFGGDLVLFIGNLPKSFNVTIGFEVDPNQGPSYLQLRLLDATIDDIIAEFVKKSPNYTWRRDRNTIEILPRTNSSSLLDTPVETFKVQDASAREAVRELLRLTEVQTAIAQFGLRLAPVIEAAPNPGTKISLDLQNVNVRQVLGKIAEDSGWQYWKFQRTGPRKEYFSISFQ